MRAEREAGATGSRRIAADEMKGESEAAARKAVSCFALKVDSVVWAIARPFESLDDYPVVLLFGSG